MTEHVFPINGIIRIMSVDKPFHYVKSTVKSADARDKMINQYMENSNLALN